MNPQLYAAFTQPMRERAMFREAVPLCPVCGVNDGFTPVVLNECVYQVCLPCYVSFPDTDALAAFVRGKELGR